LGAGLLADAVLVLHLAFVVFAVAGAALVAWKPWVAWLHLPAAAWAFLVEANGWVCPLTPLEQQLRRAAGEASYSGGFVERYIVALLYPAGLTPRIQAVLAGVVVIVNAALYAWVWRRYRRRRRAASGAA
jgi:hypothetical protein